MASAPTSAATDVAGLLAQAAAARTEHPAVAALRADARERLAGLELPSRARHLWRYTDPGRFLPLADTAPSRGNGDGWRIDDPVAAAAQLAGGALRTSWLDEQARRAGVVVADLHEADCEGLLGSTVGAGHGFVETINAAAWQGGVLVRVPAGVRLEQPIRLRVEADAGGAPVLPRVLVVAGADSVFEVVEGHVGGDGVPTQVLGVTEIVVGRGAEVSYGLVQRWQPSVTGHLTVRARLDAGARFQMALASFGGALYKADVGALLAGEGAQSETYGVAMGGDRQHMDHHTEHVHLAGRTHSNLDFKVALTHAARSAYTGLIRIARDAAVSEAYQENRNLLLSPDARAESIPELEILTDDVRCSHGATVAPLDEEQLFYLRSRGLPHLQATRLIVYGFLDQTLQRLPRGTRERIEALVAARLHAE